MQISFSKLYRYDRIKEHCYVAIPFAKGILREEREVQLFQNDKRVPVQTKVTSKYDDGSIRYLFVRFLADLPANRGTALEMIIRKRDEREDSTEAFRTDH